LFSLTAAVVARIVHPAFSSDFSARNVVIAPLHSSVIAKGENKTLESTPIELWCVGFANHTHVYGKYDGIFNIGVLDARVSARWQRLPENTGGSRPCEAWSDSNSARNFA